MEYLIFIINQNTRKPASEPNLLKIRLKQSVIDRTRAARAGPAAKRQERILSAHYQRRLQKIALAQASSM